MPVVGMGTVSYPRAEPEIFRSAMLEAIAVGYRHFDTGALTLYGTEKPLGDAIAEALQCGLIKDRKELFITTKVMVRRCSAGSRASCSSGVSEVKQSHEMILSYLLLF